METVTKLRKKFREGGVEYKVLKNTLAKRAAKGTPVEVISEDFTGPVASCIGYGDVVAPGEDPPEFIKDLETIKVRSAVVEGKKVDAKGVEGAGEVAGSARAPGEDPRDDQPAGWQAGPHASRRPGSQLARVLKAARSRQRQVDCATKKQTTNLALLPKG